MASAGAGTEGSQTFEAMASPRTCPDQRLRAGDGAVGDWFGAAVSLSGDVVVVGAYRDDDAGPDSGSAHVYRHDGTTWIDEQKLTASDGAADDWFGFSVAVSGDVVVVGALFDDAAGLDAGSAYVYRHDGTAWVEEQKLTAGDAAPGDWFGYSVAVSGGVVIVGANLDDGAGSSHVYRHDGTTWVGEQKLTAGDSAVGDWYGVSVSVSRDVSVVGARRNDGAISSSGAAYVYRHDGTTWIEEQKLTAGDGASDDLFGDSVSVSDGVVIVGAHEHDHGAGLESGSVYVYRHDGAMWTEEQELTASNGAAGDVFGASVSVSGNVAVVGAHARGMGFEAGSAYVYRHDGTTWIEERELVGDDGASGALFGSSVAASADVTVVGASRDNAEGTGSGAAYVFRPGTPCGSSLECDAGDDINAPCDGVQLAGSGAGGNGDPLSFQWTSSCPDASFEPSAWVSDPFVTFGSSCGISCEFTLTVDDGQGAPCTDTVQVEVDDVAPPTIDAEASDLTVECDGAGNVAEWESWLAANGGASASDACGAVTWSNDSAGSSPSGGCGATGSMAVTFTATDDCGNSSDTAATFAIEDAAAPTIDAEASDLTVECDGAGNVGEWESWLATHGGASASDACGAVTWSNDSAGSSPSGGCGATGGVAVTFTATDDCGNSSSTAAIFAIEDSLPPVIVGNPEDDACLWPPDHAFHFFSASTMSPAVGDACGSSNWVITGCTVSQPDDARVAGDPNGDGRTDGDCIVQAAGDGVSVRAERSGQGRGPRVYTVWATATDACGLSSTAPIMTVTVPHDLSPGGRCLRASERAPRR